ncbi:ROK family transcriptional regulator [Herbiconiux sp. L3-i23]|uniref:ROK family transcriptional regulator n=1 Tax=Herbiconiux sp. L3-i23 TaxID=2905871 RepID=UPI002049D715|nr:ROK family transcriptional regulator [Herbiconiux sp. L3-i23]BDI21485.1 sugar kinase [Herbiconiux sp. L3-i23]
MSISGRNVDTLRRANLSTVLELVHRSGGISRSQLTAATGLTRSTVAVLVGELVDLELVVETDPETTNRVGRPSPLVVPAPGPVVIAVNPELDAVTIAVVGLSARVEQRIRRGMDHIVTPGETVEIVVETLSALRKSALRGRRVFAIALAVPGLVRADGLVKWAPHLDWVDAPVADLVAARTGIPTVAGNDASAGGVAELLFGVGADCADLIYLNGGASGIGGAVIADGRLIGGASGYAGEFGQNRPGVLDPADRQTARGVLEDEVSRDRLLAVLGAGNVDEEQLEAMLLGSRDDAVVGELARQRRVLGAAVSNAVNVLNPSLVILGGFLGAVLASDPDDLARSVADSSVAASWSDTVISPAGLAADRLMIGAAELGFAALIADPSGAVAAAVERESHALHARRDPARS